MQFISPCGFAVVGLAVLLSACGQKAPDTQTPPTAATHPATVTKSSFQKLLGRWERPDGGYVLELKSVDADGKFEAGYFNPSPIHIERAIATTESGALKLFVLLQDANYPGCTYKLTYDTATDQLFGQYFQASMGQTYDVTFARLKQ